MAGSSETSSDDDEYRIETQTAKKLDYMRTTVEEWRAKNLRPSPRPTPRKSVPAAPQVDLAGATRRITTSGGRDINPQPSNIGQGTTTCLLDQRTAKARQATEALATRLEKETTSITSGLVDTPSSGSAWLPTDPRGIKRGPSSASPSSPSDRRLHKRHVQSSRPAAIQNRSDLLPEELELDKFVKEWPNSVGKFVDYNFKYNTTLTDMHTTEEVIPELERSKPEKSGHRTHKTVTASINKIAKWMKGFETWSEAYKEKKKTKMPYIARSDRLQALQYLDPTFCGMGQKMHDKFASVDLEWLVKGDHWSAFWKGALLDDHSFRATYMLGAHAEKEAGPPLTDIERIVELMKAVFQIRIQRARAKGETVQMSSEAEPRRPKFHDEDFTSRGLEYIPPVQQGKGLSLPRSHSTDELPVTSQGNRAQSRARPNPAQGQRAAREGQTIDLTGDPFMDNPLPKTTNVASDKHYTPTTASSSIFSARPSKPAKPAAPIPSLLSTSSTQPTKPAAPSSSMFKFSVRPAAPTSSTSSAPSVAPTKPVTPTNPPTPTSSVLPAPPAALTAPANPVLRNEQATLKRTRLQQQIDALQKECEKQEAEIQASFKSDVDGRLSQLNIAISEHKADVDKINTDVQRLQKKVDGLPSSTSAPRTTLDDVQKEVKEVQTNNARLRLDLDGLQDRVLTELGSKQGTMLAEIEAALRSEINTLGLRVTAQGMESANHLHYDCVPRQTLARLEATNRAQNDRLDNQFDMITDLQRQLREALGQNQAIEDRLGVPNRDELPETGGFMDGYGTSQGGEPREDQEDQDGYGDY